MHKILNIIKKIFLYYIIIRLSVYYRIQYASSYFTENTENNPKISIFIPIYNKGKYLQNTIGSLLTQTLKEIEIIAVNDGSTDNSLKVLKKLSRYDKRIKIINNDRNHGPFYSRAMGIINSTGEYMMNLDADDKLINDNSLKLIYNKIKPSKTDYLRYLINRIPVKENETIIFDFLNKNQLSNEDFLITNKLVPRNIYLEAYSYLEERIFGYKWIVHDDNIWNILVRKYSNNSIIFNKYIYYYKRNEESLNTLRGSLIDLKSLVYRLEMLLKINGQLEKNNFKYYLNQIINLYNLSVSEPLEKEMKNKIHKIYIKYMTLNNVEYYFKKETNYQLVKIFDNKIIIFYDSEDNYFITYLIRILALLLYNKMKKKILFVDSKNIDWIKNYIYYNDILIGVNNAFFTKELNFVINCYPSNRLLVISNILNKTLIKRYNLKKKNFFNFVKLVCFDNSKTKFSQYTFHFIHNSNKNFEKFLHNIRNHAINKILILFINKTNINDFEQNFKLIKSKYSFIFKYIDSPLNIIKLINIIKKYKLIITDSDTIVNISSALFTSCILFVKKNASENPQLINKINLVQLNDLNNIINYLAKI